MKLDNIFCLKANNGFYISVQQDGKIELNQNEINKNEQLSMTINKKESFEMEYI